MSGLSLLSRPLLINETKEKKTNKRKFDDFSGIPKELVSIITCPICLEFIDGKLYQCILGHVICSVCILKINKCPICRSKIEIEDNKIQCLGIEKLREIISIPCNYYEKGCVKQLKYSEFRSHLKTCAHRNISCFLKLMTQRSEGCTWEGSAEDAIAHVINFHKDKVNKPGLFDRTDFLINDGFVDRSSKAFSDEFVKAEHGIWANLLTAKPGGWTYIFKTKNYGHIALRIDSYNKKSGVRLTVVAFQMPSFVRYLRYKITLKFVPIPILIPSTLDLLPPGPPPPDIKNNTIIGTPIPYCAVESREERRGMKIDLPPHELIKEYKLEISGSFIRVGTLDQDHELSAGDIDSEDIFGLGKKEESDDDE